MSQPTPYRVNSLSKALDVLEAFSTKKPEWGLSELSRALAIGKPTLHRLLRTLEARGYLMQHAITRRYRLGLRAWELGSTAVKSTTPTDVARPWIRRLGNAMGEQVTLWVYDHGSVVCVDRAEGRHQVRTHTNLGAREDCWTVASGRCLLAYQPEEEQKRVIGGSGGEDAGRLSGRLELIRRRGYDISFGDRWADVCAVSAPILGQDGLAVASVTVSVVRSRFSKEFSERAIRAMLEAAAGISADLGAQEGLRAS